MFLLLSQEFHSSLPNAVPCRVDEIKSEDSERTIPRPRSPTIAAEGEKVCVPEASISHLGLLPGRCHHFLEEYFIVILQRMILQKSCLKHPPPASWISLVKCQSWDSLLLGPSEGLTLFGETSQPELEVCKTNAFSPGRGSLTIAIFLKLSYRNPSEVEKAEGDCFVPHTWHLMI